MGGCLSRPDTLDHRRGSGPAPSGKAQSTRIAASRNHTELSTRSGSVHSSRRVPIDDISVGGSARGLRKTIEITPSNDEGYLPGSAPDSPELPSKDGEPMDLCEITGRTFGNTSKRVQPQNAVAKSPSAGELLSQHKTPLQGLCNSNPNLSSLDNSMQGFPLQSIMPPSGGGGGVPFAMQGMGTPQGPLPQFNVMNMPGSMHGPLSLLGRYPNNAALGDESRGGMGSMQGGVPLGSMHGGVPVGSMHGSFAMGSMHGGLAAMGSASIHAGMATGSLHGGGMPRASSVALRALQAAKLRATKPALERHNVQIEGHGSELLVFSHAFGFNRTVWKSAVDSFDKSKYKIVLYDLTGALGSDYDAFDFQRYSTLHGFAEDLLLLLSELGVEASDWGQQCTFIGHQHSGMVGLLASIERPKVFKRIIMIASTPRLLDAPGYEGSFALADLDQVFGIMQANFKTWSKGFAPVLNSDDIKAAHVRDLSRPLFNLRPDIAFSNLKTAFACDVRDILPKVSVQVHMLFLAKDQTVPQSVVQFMLNSIPNAFAEILPAESFLARPDVIAAGILRHSQMPLRDFKEASKRFGSRRFAPLASGEDDRPFDVDEAPLGWKQEGVHVDIT